MTDQQKANNEQNRTSRSADTRAKKDARKPWSPPTMLDTPLLRTVIHTAGLEQK